MPSILDSFLFEIGWKTDGFQKGEKDIQEGVKRTGETFDKNRKMTETANKRTTESLMRLKNEVLGVALAFTGASSIKGFVDNMIKGDAATGRLADNIGVATESLSAWQGIAKQAGGTAEDANAAFSNLNNLFQTWQMGGGIQNGRTLQRLGISIDDLKNPETALLKLASAQQRMGLSRRDFVTLAQQLGIPDAVITQLAKGTAGVNALLQEQRALGTATKESSEEAKAYESAMAALSQRISSTFRPAITGAALDLVNFMDQLQGANNGTHTWVNSLGEAVRDIDQVLGDLVSGNFADIGAVLKRNLHDAAHGGGSPPRHVIVVRGTSTGGGANGAPGTAWTSAQLESVARSIPGAYGFGGGRGTARNRQVGGVANSQHINDQGHDPTALDFQAPGYSIAQIKAIFAKAGASVQVIYHNAGSGYHFHVQAPPGLLAASRHMAAARAAGSYRGHQSMSNSQTHIGHITVITKATDAKGIAASLPDAIKRRSLTTQANRGLDG